MGQLGFVKRDERLDLRFARRANEAQSEAKGGAIVRLTTSFLPDPPAEGLGSLDIDRVIHRHESLQRRIGANPPDGANLTTGGVEGGHGRIRNRPPPERVKAAAILVLA